MLGYNVVHCGDCGRDLFFDSPKVLKCPCGEFLYLDAGDRAWGTEALKNAEKNINWTSWKVAPIAREATLSEIDALRNSMLA